MEYGDLDKRYQQSTFGAHFVEVGVDAATGEVRVRRMLAVCACGRTAQWKVLTKKPIQAAPEEVAENPRARSARLRAVERLS